jgi:hypothetical protein
MAKKGWLPLIRINGRYSVVHTQRREDPLPALFSGSVQSMNVSARCMPADRISAGTTGAPVSFIYVQIDRELQWIPLEHEPFLRRRGTLSNFFDLFLGDSVSKRFRSGCFPILPQSVKICVPGKPLPKNHSPGKKNILLSSAHCR